MFSITMILLVSSISIGIGGQQTDPSKDTTTYNGDLRIYIVEPTSRWNNYDGEPYHFGFLDFAFNDKIQIAYQDTYTNSITWDGDQAGFSNIQEDNILVIASLFNPEIHKGYSYPPTKSPFEAHYVDAAAAATPGNTASNTVTENFTHTVFVEEATAESCPHCPAMADALYSAYTSEQYPFYFVALITKDKQGNVINQVALDHLVTEYNLAAYPSAYFDGGFKTLVGGYDDPNQYSTRITSSGQRDVHDVDLTVSVQWLGQGNLKIDISIKNNEEFLNQPPGLPAITGPERGKFGENQSYQITAQDPDGNDLYFYIDWGDGTDIELIGPYGSGRTTTVKHNWAEKGSYTIKVMSRDVYDEKSDWASLEVSMPKQHLPSPYLQSLRERYQRVTTHLLTLGNNR